MHGSVRIGRPLALCAGAVVAIAAGHSVAQSQDVPGGDEIVRAWACAGLGVGSPGYLAANVSGTVQYNHSMLTARVSAVSAGLFDDEFSEYGLLFGYCTIEERWNASFAIGVAAVSGSRGNGLFAARESLPTKLGFPIEAQVFYHLADWIGVGVCGMADFNSIESWTGATVCLQIGKLR